jgi:hypothetical protein
MLTLYDELKLLLCHYTPEEIFETSKRLVNFEAAKINQIDMVRFAGRLCRMDEDNWRENR